MNETQKIKDLREAIGLSFQEIKRALDEAGGDKTKAIEILKAHDVIVAQKKSSRLAKEGVIGSYVHATKKIGAIVEVLCETDFVARNSEFQKLAHDLAMQIVATKPEATKDLLSQQFIKDQDITIQDLINQHIAKLGENIQIGKFEILEI